MDRTELSQHIEKSGFIFRGRFAARGAPGRGAEAQAPDKAVTVTIDEVLLSAESLRGLGGRQAILVGDHAEAIARMPSCVFFTRCATVGQQLVAQEIAHVEATPDTLREIGQLLQELHERPLRERVAGADLIVKGKVHEVKRVEGGTEAGSEHDPDWHIARVTVQSLLKGDKPAKEIEVLFAASLDIAWYKAPKLREGEAGILLLRQRKANEASPALTRAVFQALDPLDFLAIDRLDDVERALAPVPGER